MVEVLLVGLTVTGSAGSKGRAKTKDGVHLPGWTEAGSPAIEARFFKDSVEISLRGVTCVLDASQSLDAPAAVRVTLHNQDSSPELCKLGLSKIMQD